MVLEYNVPTNSNVASRSNDDNYHYYEPANDDGDYDDGGDDDGDTDAEEETFHDWLVSNVPNKNTYYEYCRTCDFWYRNYGQSAYDHIR